MHPEARRERLLAQDVGDELVVYDERNHRAHRLNGTARIVWQAANGRHSIRQIASLVHEKLGAPQSEALVRVTLDELAQADLLVRRPTGLVPGEATSRRRILTTAAAAFVPVIASIVAPRPADAQSNPMQPPPNPSLDSFNGTYEGTGTLMAQAVPGTCGDDNLAEMVNLRGVLSLGVNAANPWVKTHLPDAEFAFSTVNTLQVGSTVNLTASGTFSPPGWFFNYAVMESYQVQAGRITGRQTFTLSVCTWIYVVDMTRQP